MSLLGSCRSVPPAPVNAVALIVICLSLSAQAEEKKHSEKSPPEAAVPGDPAKDPQIFRPGLRNSFVERQLSAKELNLALTQLRHKTGFAQMRFDKDGFLTIDDRRQIVGGSAAARELVLAAVDGKKSINLQSHNRSPNVAFGRLGEGVKYIRWQTDVQIDLTPIEIDFADFNHLRGDPKAVAAFDPGFVILHELCHAALELRDPLAGMKVAGDCESYVNRIRRELGMPERQQYAATAYRQTTFPSGSTVRIAELIFAQTEPGREPESRAKTKTLYLTWDAQRVGNIRPASVPPTVKEKTGAATAAAP
jgi:hypothetical protein